jgi:hypothetical protein
MLLKIFLDASHIFSIAGEIKFISLFHVCFAFFDENSSALKPENVFLEN